MPLSHEQEQEELRQAANETFNPAALSFYYAKFFPYHLLFRWLSYGQDPDSKKSTIVHDFFARREFSFTMEGDIYIRYLSFRDQAELMKQIQQKQPHKIDIGAVFNASPARYNSIKAGAFKPVERELVFDIDMTDYDDVRTCCSGASVCRKCWPLMTAALKVMDAGLREDFGFQHLVWIFSGRRGIHCWVCDDIARALPNEARAAVVDYFSIVSGSNDSDTGKGVHIAVKKKGAQHPAHIRAFEILKPRFLEMAETDSQGWLGDDEERRRPVLDFIPENVQKDVLEKWLKCRNAESRWKAIEDSMSKHSEEKNVLYSIVFNFCYPKLDANVSKTKNHLLKSPFCVHPKTGRICVPIDTEKADSFWPDNVPTMAQVIVEARHYDQKRATEATDQDEEDAFLQDKTIARSHEYRKTSLGPYFDNFERKFLKPMERKIDRVQHERAEAGAAFTGQW